MSNNKVLGAFLAATIIAAGGSAWATVQAATNASTGQTAAEKDFTKLSADGARAYNDVALARVAIYDGKTDDAKKLVADADTAFAKSKGDDTVYMKAEHNLMTSQQMAAKSTKQPAETTPKATDTPQTAWLPVDGSISLNEDYSLNPVKKQAVADANQSIAKGDRKGAMDKLKLADMDMSIALKVVPLDATIADVHQANTLIDSGHYFEGSQMLRKVQMAARYDVTDIVGTPKSAASDKGATATPATAEPSTAKPTATR